MSEYLCKSALFFSIMGCVVLSGCAKPQHLENQTTAVTSKVVSYQTLMGSDAGHGGVSPWILGSSEDNLNNKSNCTKLSSSMRDGVSSSTYRCVVSVAEPGMPQASGVLLTYLDKKLIEIKLALLGPVSTVPEWRLSANTCWDFYKQGLGQRQVTVQGPANSYNQQSGQLNLDLALKNKAKTDLLPELEFYYPQNGTLIGQFISMSSAGCTFYARLLTYGILSASYFFAQDIKPAGIEPFFLGRISESEMGHTPCKKLISQSHTWMCNASIDRVRQPRVAVELHLVFGEKDGLLETIWFRSEKGDFEARVGHLLDFVDRMCGSSRITGYLPDGRRSTQKLTLAYIKRLYEKVGTPNYTRLVCGFYSAMIGPDDSYFSIQKLTENQPNESQLADHSTQPTVVQNAQNSQPNQSVQGITPWLDHTRASLLAGYSKQCSPKGKLIQCQKLEFLPSGAVLDVRFNKAGKLVAINGHVDVKDMNDWKQFLTWLTLGTEVSLSGDMAEKIKGMKIVYPQRKFVANIQLIMPKKGKKSDASVSHIKFIVGPVNKNSKKKPSK